MENNFQTYLHKLLNGEITSEELEILQSYPEFKGLESFINLPPEVKDKHRFDKESSYQQIIEKRNNSTSSPGLISIIRPHIGKIAAIIVIALAVMLTYIYKNDNVTTSAYEVAAAQAPQTINLPDKSIVHLNSNSSISYLKNDWHNNRNIDLNGEAFFEVEKGQQFTVRTTLGNVQVLGTKFNVFQRKDSFEVICYEGKVKVTYADQEVILTQNEQFNQSQVAASSIQLNHYRPQWIDGKFTYKKASLQEVMNDISTRYGMTYHIEPSVADSLRYTGAYTHDQSLKDVLTIITTSLDIHYIIKENTITLLP